MYSRHVTVIYKGTKFKVLVYCTPNTSELELHNKAVNMLKNNFEVHDIDVVES